jgi:putative two-component system response regulator
LSLYTEEQTVARLAEILALECGVPAKDARQIRVAAVMHDVGKQRIPPEILNKPGELTPAEFEVMKTHTTLGAVMLENIQGKLGFTARTIARYHHESWDGSGYWGKFLCELPYYVEIVAISDVFTALMYGRAYKPPWLLSEALEYIEARACRQFSPQMVDVFLPLARKDRRVSSVFQQGGGSHSGGY